MKDWYIAADAAVVKTGDGDESGRLVLLTCPRGTFGKARPVRFKASLASFS